MTKSELIEEAKVIAGRNVFERLAQVDICFDEKVGHLRTYFYLDAPPTDDEIQWCELTCGELIAAYPEIRTAEVSYPSLLERKSDQAAGDTVYLRLSG